MPLTDFQLGISRLLAKNRNPSSHVAGGAVLNRGPDTVRFSDDLDIFHDIGAAGAENLSSVTARADADATLLQNAGYSVEWKLRQEGLLRAVVSRGQEHLRLDWTTDSRFRFFPVQPDADFGFCLHWADLATNKVLAMAGRSEARDFLDILYLDEKCLSVGALVWAACGKDPGFTPGLIMDQLNRHSRFRQADLESENLVQAIDVTALKAKWLAARDRALRLFDRLPAEELGCLYLDPTNAPVTPDPESSDFARLIRHWGSEFGAWPAIS
jgi:hypothetical protein